MIWIENIHAAITTCLLGEKPEHSEVFRLLLDISSEWDNIGALLKISPGTLANINQESSTLNSKLRYMLNEWMKMVDPPPSWKQLIAAVESFNEAKAEELKLIASGQHVRNRLQ